MSPDLREEVALELGQMRLLFRQYRKLFDKASACDPDDTEQLALAAILHSFYTGIENICKRILLHRGELLPKGEAWHQDLLALMTKPEQNRPAVFSEKVFQVLIGYLEFRHVFRQAYAVRLKWHKMANLVRECENTFTKVERELDRFFAGP